MTMGVANLVLGTGRIRDDKILRYAILNQLRTKFMPSIGSTGNHQYRVALTRLNLWWEQKPSRWSEYQENRDDKRDDPAKSPSSTAAFAWTPIRKHGSNSIAQTIVKRDESFHSE